MRFTISMKVVVSILALLLFSTILGGYFVVSSYQISGDSSDIEKEYLPAMAFSGTTSTELLNLQKVVLAYSLSPTESFYNEALEQFESYSKILKTFSNHLSKPYNQALMPTIANEIKIYESLANNYIATSKENTRLIHENRAVEVRYLQVSESITALAANLRNLQAENFMTNGRRLAFDDVTSLIDNMIKVEKISLNSLQAYTAFSNGVLTNDMKLLNKANSLTKETHGVLASLFQTVKIEESLRDLNSLEKNLTELEKLMQITLSSYESITKLIAERTRLAEELRDSDNKITLMLNQDVAAASANNVKTLDFVSMVTIGLTIFLIIFGIIIIAMLKMSVINQINSFVTLVGDLTKGDGDLTKRIHAKSNDELADLAERFNQFIENVQVIVREVKTSSEELASGNNQLAATMEELSTTFNSQTEQISGIVLDMGNISESTKVAVEELNTNLKMMNTTSENTDSGAKQLDVVKESIQDIHVQTQSLSETINRLTESTSQIGGILMVINDIADQTNLLALNAAIEAARAGDAGRGFAVVADEVRKLAERTQKATSEIEGIVNTLQRESELASTEMNKASVSVAKGVELIDDTAVSFISVVNGVDNVTSNTQSVVEKFSHQYKVVEGVGDRTQVIASGVEESNAAVSEVASTVSHLQELTEQMKSLVGKFKA